MILIILGAQGLILEAGPNFEEILDCCDFEDASCAKGPPFEVKMRPLTHIVQCWVFDVFLSAH